MKKDNLERFVRDNQEAFDQDPLNDLWRKIEAGLDKQQPDQAAPGLNGSTGPANASPFQQIHRPQDQSTSAKTGRTGWFWQTLDWRVAASIAVLILAGSFLYVNQQYGVAHQPDVVAASPLYAREVVQYTRLIDNKRAELKQMTEDNPALYREFATDLDRLEKSYQSLKADLPQNPNQDVLIQAMIQNLHYQINLLNEQLRVIQRINRQTNENPV
ncbi:hypothetical protein [Spirosoma utsteinense]|uniref:Anti-sigma factor n=1 Tax=Spirosoma utsteinense TaxID=2585773 RepID=A0ABR6W163_9BACT|nr:hypothetical protein [Spirosoma utsteinense]MBC3783670.1 hypothetical protein [Spirosoma utsteinense]MBC3790187.1 hypothetical protein [Spirosoma utsteinense]